MKVAAYCATRNLYPRMLPAINSLLSNNPGIDRVYCLLEDDSHPLIDDKRVKVINTKSIKDKYINMETKNARSVFTYMALMRIAFPRVFEDLDKILYLDVDTIVDQNIEDLWDIDMTDKAVAGCIEKQELRHPKDLDYINSGVLFMNLEYFRQHDLDTKMWEMLNDKSTKYEYPDQDVINIVCKNAKHFLPLEYNELFVTQYSAHPKIVHYGGVQEWWLRDKPRNQYYQKYKCKRI